VGLFDAVGQVAQVLTITRNTLTPNIQRLIQDFPKEAASALHTEAEFVMTNAKERTPVEFGVLKASGQTHPPKVKAGEVSVALTFGGDAREYAIYVHENLHAFHPVGEAKFLERAVLEAAPHLPSRVAKRINLRRMVR